YFILTYGQLASPLIYDGDGAARQFFASMALWPTGVQPVLTVGWTLTFELAFYALFAALLLLPARFRMGAIFLWGLFLMGRLILDQDLPALPESWLGILISPLCLEFVFGAVVAWLIRRMTIPRWLGFGLFYVGAIGFLGLMIAADTLGGLPDVRSRTISFGVAAAILIAGLVAMERTGRFTPIPGLRAIGDASYTLYLSHLLVILSLKRICEALDLMVAPTRLSMIGFMGLALIVSVLASLILYRILEKPLLKLSRALLPKTRSETV
ncbi:MAG: acyltransferase, partial [Pseudomonadota bacterium]